MSEQAVSKEAGLDRKIIVPKLIGNSDDFLIVAGLAGTARDVCALSQDGDNCYLLAGVMGAAVMMGAGLALAQPDRRVLVVTGDGELLMGLGSLPTVAIMGLANLAILCIDNGHYGETGYQESHTMLGTDLLLMAEGAGISNTRLVTEEADIPDAARLLRESNGPSFVLAKVGIQEPASYKRSLDATAAKVRFRQGLGFSD